MNKDGKKIVVQSPLFGGTFANIFVEHISKSGISVSQGRCTFSLKMFFFQTKFFPKIGCLLLYSTSNTRVWDGDLLPFPLIPEHKPIRTF